MTEDKREETQRDNAVTIAMVEEKPGQSGQFYRIKGTDGTWYSCFEHPLNPAPAVGQVWACNIKQKGEWNNLHDMLYSADSNVPVQPAAPQQRVTHEDVVSQGPTRECSIIRQSCLKSAAAACHIDMTNAEESLKTVLTVAERFFDWVTR